MLTLNNNLHNWVVYDKKTSKAKLDNVKLNLLTCLTDDRSVLLPINIEGTFFDIVACWKNTLIKIKKRKVFHEAFVERQRGTFDSFVFSIKRYLTRHQEHVKTFAGKSTWSVYN